MKKTLLSILMINLALHSTAQFGGQNIISTNADEAKSVFAIDLDGDQNIDVLSASSADNSIRWYQNLGGGMFSSDQIIANDAIGASCVYATDIDGDLDADVFSASNDAVVWYENLGNGTFSNKKLIDDNSPGARSVITADIDGDNLIDVVAAALYVGKFQWYKNLGNGSFGSPQEIGSEISYCVKVLAADLDNDGDQDVIGVTDYPIYWFENLANGQFGPAQELASLFYMESGAVADTDGDGDQDIIATSTYYVIWIENLGNGTFQTPVFIDETGGGSYADFADLNGDGNQDLMIAKGSSWDINVYENNGDGSFASRQTISSEVVIPSSVYGADLDSDGDIDILSASKEDDKIAWYENLMPSAASPYILTSQNDIIINYNSLQDKVIIDGDFENFQIAVFDSAGILIEDYSNASNPLTIDLNSLGAGMYFISASHNTKPNLYVYKMIKQ